MTTAIAGGTVRTKQESISAITLSYQYREDFSQPQHFNCKGLRYNVVTKNIVRVISNLPSWKQGKLFFFLKKLF